MAKITGCLLVPTRINPETGLWFIFHHESDGVLAFDLTTPHPDIPYRRFEAVLDDEDMKSPQDKIVLLGGPMQPDVGMLVLHNNPKANKDSHIINNDFAFLSYRYVVVPGMPPVITRSDDKPSRIALGPAADFIVTIGFRVWEMDALEDELRRNLWTLLPATPGLVFRTSHGDRLKRALLSIN